MTRSPIELFWTAKKESGYLRILFILTRFMPMLKGLSQRKWPASEKFQVASFKRYVSESTTFFKRLPWTSLALNMMHDLTSPSF